jgi:hypothetical protein
MPERKTGHDDINARAVALTAAAVAAAIAVAAIAAYLIWHAWLAAGAASGPNAAFDFPVAGPVLESAPQPSRAAYMAEKQVLLDGYQWLDRNQGIARIPVEQAMRVLAGQAEQKQSEEDKR